MTRHQIATLGKMWIDHLEASIEELPEGDQKATATHHATRIHHHMNALYRMALDRGDVTTQSGGEPKTP